MDNKLLTVVVPTYNMEKLLSRCLNSLLLSPETMKLYEVIIVIDGGSDASSDIAHSYSNRCPDTFIVIDKENGNYGSCVNAGLAVARGTYFRILDADDEFDRDAFFKFIETIRGLEQEVDMLMTNYKVIYDNTDRVRSLRCNFDYGKIVSFHSLDFLTSGNAMMVVMHTISYRTSLLKGMGYKQQTGISYTDTEFVFIPMICVNTILLIDICLYSYHMGREGQTVTMNPSRMRTEQYYKVANRLLELYVEHYNAVNPSVRHTQSCCLKNVISSYFLYSLLYLPKEQNTEGKLRGIKSRILSVDKNFWTYLSSVKKSRVKYIQLWERHGIYLSENWLFRLLFKIYRLFK